ncbi:MAG: 6-phosphogluconolactonase [Isosphaeraceae bacterium]|nr:6-phosphogluconolactonase [Isosphaeraceae bacterium]
MSRAAPVPRAEFQVDQLRVLVFEDRAQMGRAAAAAVARSIAARQGVAARTNVVFAAAQSQNELLTALIAHSEIDWSRVVAFHMDEYLGIDADHPASFRRYLQEHLFRLAGLKDDQLRLIPGEQTQSPLRTCLEYEERLRAEPPDIVCAGIGENGHLAFNDPPVADFLDPVLVKVVRMDEACRRQQFHESCFDRIEDIPTHGYTMTVPALLAAPVVSVVVPGARKAEAVLATLRGPIGEACPASALRRHPGAVLYTDRDAARLVV